jgi:hypothetical protein
MAYIGKGLDNGVRNRFIFAATQGQTAFTGSDLDGKTLTISDALYCDVYHNGVKIKLTTDWSSSTTTMTLVTGASVNDVIEIISFDVFGVPNTVPSFGGTFTGAISATSYGAVSGTTGTFSGDVAINGASATHPLSVNGQIKSTGANGETLQLQTSSQYSGISFIGSDGTRDAIIDYDHTNGALGLKAHTSSHYINFMTGGYSERFRITDNGVTFNGDTAAANALDDYEEGTHSTTITVGSGSVSSYTSRILSYTVVGNMVTVTGRIHVGLSATNVTSFTFTLPFAGRSNADSDTSAVMHAIRSTDTSPSAGEHAGLRIFRVNGTANCAMETAAGGATGNFGTQNLHLNVNITYRLS